MGGSSQNKAEVKQEIPSDRASSGSRKVSERYRDPSADVELISSDGTSFMIHSYHLLSTSQVFRDLLSAPSTSSSSPSSPSSYTANEPKIIRLTDNSIEHKQQVEDLLDLIHGVSLSGIAVDNIERFRRLARLILKYDCPAPLRMLRTHVRAEMAEGHVGPIHKFFLSMLLDDPRGCRDAIRLAGGRRWGSEGSAPIDKAGPNQAVSGENTFDPGCMSTSLLERFPSRYLACYLRACRLRGTMEGTGGEWGKVADEFYRLMMMD